MHSMDLSFLETQMLHWQLGTGITGSRVIEQHLTRKISKRKSFSAYMVVSLRIGGNRRLVATEHWWQWSIGGNRGLGATEQSIGGDRALVATHRIGGNRGVGS